MAGSTVTVKVVGAAGSGSVSSSGGGSVGASSPSAVNGTTGGTTAGTSSAATSLASSAGQAAGSVVGTLAYGAGAAAAIGTAAIAIFKSVKGELLSQAQEMANISPVVAQAQANASIRSMNQDFREAAELGPAMARLVEAQNKADIALQQIWLPIKKVLLEVIATTMEQIAEALRELKIYLAQIWGVMEKLSEVRSLSGLFDALSGMQKHLEGIRRGLERQNVKDDTELPSFMQDFLSISASKGGAAGGPGDGGGGGNQPGHAMPPGQVESRIRAAVRNMRVQQARPVFIGF